MHKSTWTGIKPLFVALCCLSLWAAATNAATVKTKETTLKAFSAITDCLPFNVKVEPSSKDDTYKLVVEGEASVRDAVEAKVNNGVLSLGLAKGFKTERAIKVTVMMPKDALDTITKASTSVMVLAPGFELKALTIRASGVSHVRLFDVDIADLVVVSEGSSEVAVAGTIEKANFDVSGTSKAYCYGLESSAEVSVADIGRVFIDAASSDVTIGGTTDGLGRVFVTKGDCTIEETFFSAGCERIRVNALPSFEALYSCGLNVDGRIACRSGRGRGTTFTSSRVDSASASTFSSSSSSGSGSSFSSASASSSTGGSSTSSSSVSRSAGGHRFDSLVTSSGKGADAVAVAATRCTDKDLSMFEEKA